MKKALCVLVLVGFVLCAGCDVVVGDITTTAEDTIDAVVSGVEDGVEAVVSDVTEQVCGGIGQETCTFIGIK